MDWMSFLLGVVTGILLIQGVRWLGRRLILWLFKTYTGIPGEGKEE